MGVLNDVEITRLSTEGWQENPPFGHMVDQIRTFKMITPFAEGVKRPGKISYGVSSYGYDFRLAGEFEVFDRAPGEFVHTPAVYETVIDPKNFAGAADTMRRVTCAEDEPLIMPPHSFALGVSLECFAIPRDVITFCLGKSTYARCGLYVNITPLEPEWEGHVTVELTNPTPRPLAVYPYEGIAQLVFLQAGHDMATVEATLDAIADFTVDFSGCRLICRQSYADKRGKYQNQGRKIVHPTVDTEDGGAKGG